MTSNKYRVHMAVPLGLVKLVGKTFPTFSPEIVFLYLCRYLPRGRHWNIIGIFLGREGNLSHDILIFSPAIYLLISYIIPTLKKAETILNISYFFSKSVKTLGIFLKVLQIKCGGGVGVRRAGSLMAAADQEVIATYPSECWGNVFF